MRRKAASGSGTHPLHLGLADAKQFGHGFLSEATRFPQQRKMQIVGNP
jgi:hypothetical protein